MSEYEGKKIQLSKRVYSFIRDFRVYTKGPYFYHIREIAQLMGGFIKMLIMAYVLTLLLGSNIVKIMLVYEYIKC